MASGHWRRSIRSTPERRILVTAGVRTVWSRNVRIGDGNCRPGHREHGGHAGNCAGCGCAINVAGARGEKRRAIFSGQIVDAAIGRPPRVSRVVVEGKLAAGSINDRVAHVGPGPEVAIRGGPHPTPQLVAHVAAAHGGTVGNARVVIHVDDTVSHPRGVKTVRAAVRRRNVKILLMGVQQIMETVVLDVHQCGLGRSAPVSLKLHSDAVVLLKVVVTYDAVVTLSGTLALIGLVVFDLVITGL